MRLLYSLCIALSTYSKIPVPQVEWNEKNMRYSLCFFPLVGVVIGALALLWLHLCAWFAVGPVLKGAVGCALPLLVSGGIHMDGFMDALDALASRQPPERKLQILKDSHVGAFAAMGCALYLLLTAGVYAEATVGVIALGFVLSRALSALSLVTMKSVSQGLLKAFSDSAQRRAVRAVMAAWLIACAVAALIIRPLPALAGLVAAGLVYLYYWRMSARQFGGITGDLAGYFLTICEIAYAFAVVFVGRLV
jgi:adenosylcobinamide-GDP ribazoletransferase